MDQESFETVSLPKEVIGDTAHFLTDGMDVDLQYFNGSPINVQLPPKMTFEVVETEPGVKGDRAQAGTKPAKIDTGYMVSVPLFVEKGEKIVINTDSGEYIERARD
jgi:elongation factor P